MNFCSSPKIPGFVKTYTLQFSNDGVTFSNYSGNVTFYKDWSPHSLFENNVLFTANFDQATVIKNELNPPLNARFVRLRPKDIYGKGSLQWEVFACDVLLKENLKEVPIGCYGDDPKALDLPFVPYRPMYSSMRPELCVSHCFHQGYHFAGVENGQVNET